MAKELPEAGRHAWNSFSPSVCRGSLALPDTCRTDLGGRAALGGPYRSVPRSPPPLPLLLSALLESANQGKSGINIRHHISLGSLVIAAPTCIIRKSNTVEWGSWLLGCAKVIA